VVTALAQQQPDLDYAPDDFFPGPYRPDTQFYIDRLSEATMQTARRLRRGRILDVACGTAKEMIQLSQKGWQAWGLDASDKMLTIAHRDAQQQRVSVPLVRSIAERLPFRDSSFDRLVCKGSLDHFADPEAFIREAARVLKPKGLAVIALANYESLSCKLGRWLYPLFLRLGWMSKGERPYWVIPPDHTFKGDYDRIIRLGDGWLRLRKCFGVSLLWLFPGWGNFLDKLPRSLAYSILRTADSIARLTPGMSDVIISVWSPRPEVKRRRASRRAGRQRRRTG
jgi:SAM-dependent methyltransferase